MQPEPVEASVPAAETGDPRYTRALALAGAVGLWVLPTLVLFILYWSIAGDDNGMIRLQGDTTVIFRKACAALASPDNLFVSHADHLVSVLYLLSAPLIAIFGASYEPYAAVLVISYGLAASGVGALIFALTRSLFATVITVGLVTFGWWYARATLINYTELVSPLVVLFICLALIQMRSLGEKRSLTQVVLISGLCLASFLTVGPGVFAFGIVGFVAAVGWVREQARAIYSKASPVFVMPDWRLAVGLFAAFGLGIAAYAYGQSLGNPPLGSADMGHGEVAASLLDRVLTLLRTAVLNLFVPNMAVDGSPVDNAFLFGMVLHSLQLPFLALVALILGLGVYLFSRDVASQTRAPSDVSVFVIAALVMFVIAGTLSVMGRPTLQLNFARYIIFPVIFFAIAFGATVGYWLRQLPKLPSWIAGGALSAGAALLCLNQQQVFDNQVSSLIELRAYLKDRPVDPWWQTCSLAPNRRQ